MNLIQAVRGMNDVLPDSCGDWRYVESRLRYFFELYGYQEIRLPIVERTELFARSIGEQTDIVAKEMYTFADRNGDSLTLRPEATAGCVRAGIENGLLHNQQQRLWYMGPMFRYERPQRGRYRQFYQAGVEALGWAGPDIDAELIVMSARIWSELDINTPELQINSLATEEVRASYRDRLVEFLRKFAADLDADSQRRLDTNPLRILDSKIPAMQEILAQAPDIRDAWDHESRRHFETLCEYLDQAGVSYRVNPRLVRGLDYYTRTVFERVSDDLGAQGTVCAGGRYDGLVQRLGNRKPMPAAGFALGLERLVEMLQTTQDISPVDAYLVMVGDPARHAGLRLAETLRGRGYRVESHYGDEGIKAQMRRADKSGARLAVIVGDDEVANASVTLKSLRRKLDQVTVSVDELPDRFTELLNN